MFEHDDKAVIKRSIGVLQKGWYCQVEAQSAAPQSYTMHYISFIDGNETESRGNMPQGIPKFLLLNERTQGQ